VRNPARRVIWCGRRSYGVDIAPGQNDALLLCVAVCLDRIHHDEEDRGPLRLEPGY
jgi:uncharacterized protein YxjI